MDDGHCLRCEGGCDQLGEEGRGHGRVGGRLDDAGVARGQGTKAGQHREEGRRAVRVRIRVRVRVSEAAQGPAGSPTS